MKGGGIVLAMERKQQRPKRGRKIRERDRVDVREIAAFETQLAADIKTAFYDDGKTIGQVVAQFAGQRPRPWVLDVIFYRRHRSADRQNAVFKHSQPHITRRQRDRKATP